MTGPGAAAAEAYIQTLPLALRRAAEADTLAAHWLAAASLGIVLVVCWIAIRSGVLVGQGRRSRPRPRLDWTRCRSDRPACGSPG